MGPKRRQRYSAGVAGLVFAVVVAVASPAASVSGSELERAKQQRAALEAQLDKSVAAYEAAESKLAKTRELLEASQSSLADAEARMEESQRKIGTRANLTYREGWSNVFNFLLTADTFGDFNRRIKLIGKVSRDDARHIREIERASKQTEEIKGDLAERLQTERILLRQMTLTTGSLAGQFAQASIVEKQLLSDRQTQLQLEKERKARAAAAAAEEAKAAKLAAAKSATPAPTLPVPTASTTAASARAKQPSPAAVRTSGGLRCPINGPNSFTDTYGAPREGGRRHEGVDMFAAQGTPTVATTDSVVHRQSTGGAGGIAVVLRGLNGTDYYYAHLVKFASISVGQKVAAGTTVGYVGATGNASSKAPHLHFEVRPGGGGPINPYSTAKAACG